MVFYGEVGCSAKYATGEKKGQRCRFRAHYKTDADRFCCGVHSTDGRRSNLPRDPGAAAAGAAALTAHEEEVEAAARANRAGGRRGEVACAKLRMRQAVPRLAEFKHVFPNNRHGSRTDGFGCATLSPMRLGPVVRVADQEFLAHSLENYWQGSKVFRSELDEYNKPTPEYYEARDRMRMDKTPHRRKPVQKEYGGERNICQGWVWEDAPDGVERRFQYVESRQFYCQHYERLAAPAGELAALRQMLAGGYNLLIIGYDGRDFGAAPGATAAEKLDHCYLDPSRPFGHELCLVAMLMLEPEQYPWRIHKTEVF